MIIFILLMACAPSYDTANPYTEDQGVYIPGEYCRIPADGDMVEFEMFLDFCREQHQEYLDYDDPAPKNIMVH